MPKQRLVVGVTGASGAVVALRFLQVLRELAAWETHLILSPAAVMTAQMELGQGREAFEALADHVYNHKDIGAALASGSFLTAGMVIVPCSMNSLAAVAHGLSHNLITRAADVTLKERRRLVLVTRETPLNLVHLRNMAAVTEAGGIIFPPVPSFYLGQLDFEGYITQICGRILDLFGINAPSVKRWQGKT
jgi:4-hydroxy-3-polyprenylbenzoate decarboxylase/2,5-furandicarboxylate decarboxylase 2